MCTFGFFTSGGINVEADGFPLGAGAATTIAIVNSGAFFDVSVILVFRRFSEGGKGINGIINLLV
jgi:hypothetical protein